MMRDISERYDHLRSSVASPLAGYLLQRELSYLNTMLRQYRGKKVLYLGALDACDVQPASAFQTVHKVCPSKALDEARCDLHSRMDALPFESGAYDTVVLHHALEYSNDPAQVIKEASRVTSHGGHVIIVGFNPVSTHGICATLVGRFMRHSFWCRKSLLLYRVRDWLKFLDFTALESRNLAHCLPLSNQRYLSLTRGIHAGLERLNLPFSPSYCIVSRKDQPGMIGRRLGWTQVVFESALPVARSAPRVGASNNVLRIQDYKQD